MFIVVRGLNPSSQVPCEGSSLYLSSSFLLSNLISSRIPVPTGISTPRVFSSLVTTLTYAENRKAEYETKPLAAQVKSTACFCCEIFNAFDLDPFTLDTLSECLVSLN